MQIQKAFPALYFFVQGILMSKGGDGMQMKGWAIAMGIGAAVGAVAVLALPRSSSIRKLAAKTAVKVEDAARRVSDKLTDHFEA